MQRYKLIKLVRVIHTYPHPLTHTDSLANTNTLTHNTHTHSKIVIDLNNHLQNKMPYLLDIYTVFV